jgi:hypothetical protein
MPSEASQDDDHYPMPSDDDIGRVNALLRKIGGPNVAWGSISVFDVLVGEHRLKRERLASDRSTRATWVLAGSTIVLAPRDGRADLRDHRELTKTRGTAG